MDLTPKLIDAIAVGIVKNISKRLDSGIEVNNLDVVKAAIVNELNRFYPTVDRAVKAICAEIKAIKLNTPETFTISNLKDLEAYFDKLSGTIQTALKIEVKAPDVNVNVPDVIVPDIKIPAPIVNVEAPQAPAINIPPFDLSPILKALDLNLNKIRTNDKGRPLAVRITDGQEWVKAIQEGVREGVGNVTVQGFSDAMFIRNASGGRVNPATDEALQQVAAGVPVQGWTTTIDESAAPTTTVITYSFNGVLKATKTISVSGTTTTITVS